MLGFVVIFWGCGSFSVCTRSALSAFVMAGEIEYAELNIHEIPSFSNVPAPQPCPDTGFHQCTQWHRYAFRAAFTFNIILTLTFLIIWGVQTQFLQKKTDVTAVNSTFWLQLKQFMCKPQEKNKEEGITDCKMCPMEWLLHQDNCYWISQDTKNFTDSQDDCNRKKATLVVIQNQEELAYIRDHTKDGFWLGLRANPSLSWNWEWVDGSPLKEELFSVEGDVQENNCVMKNEANFYSSTCSTVSHWVCEKKAFQIQ